MVAHSGTASSRDDRQILNHFKSTAFTKRSKRRSKRKLSSISQEIANNDTQRLHQRNSKPFAKKPRSSKSQNSRKSAAQRKLERAQIAIKSTSDSSLIHLKDKTSSFSANNHETLQSKICHDDTICNENVSIYPQRASLKKRRKSKAEIFEERQKYIAKIVQELLEHSSSEEDEDSVYEDEEEQKEDIINSMEVKRQSINTMSRKKQKFSMKHTMQRNTDNQWRITIHDMDITKGKKNNMIIIGAQIEDRFKSYTVYTNNKGKIFNQRDEIEDGVEMEKGMEIVINIEYMTNPQQIKMQFTYMTANSLWREESEPIFINDIRGYGKTGINVEIFVAQNRNAVGTYTISKI